MLSLAFLPSCPVPHAPPSAHRRISPRSPPPSLCASATPPPPSPSPPTPSTPSLPDATTAITPATTAPAQTDPGASPALAGSVGMHPLLASPSAVIAVPVAAGIAFSQTATGYGTRIASEVSTRVAAAAASRAAVAASRSATRSYELATSARAAAQATLERRADACEEAERRAERAERVRDEVEALEREVRHWRERERDAVKGAAAAEVRAAMEREKGLEADALGKEIERVKMVVRQVISEIGIVRNRAAENEKETPIGQSDPTMERLSEEKEGLEKRLHEIQDNLAAEKVAREEEIKRRVAAEMAVMELQRQVQGLGERQNYAGELRLTVPANKPTDGACVQANFAEVGAEATRKLRETETKLQQARAEAELLRVQLNESETSMLSQAAGEHKSSSSDEGEQSDEEEVSGEVAALRRELDEKCAAVAMLEARLSGSDKWPQISDVLENAENEARLRGGWSSGAESAVVRAEAALSNGAKEKKEKTGRALGKRARRKRNLAHKK